MILLYLKDSNNQRRSVEVEKTVKDGKPHFKVLAVHDTKTGKELDEWIRNIIEEHHQGRLYIAYGKHIRGLDAVA